MKNFAEQKEVRQILELFLPRESDYLPERFRKPFTAGDYICAAGRYGIVAVPNPSVRSPELKMPTEEELQGDNNELFKLLNKLHVSDYHVEIDVDPIRKCVKENLVKETEYVTEEVEAPHCECPHCNHKHFEDKKRETGRVVGNNNVFSIRWNGISAFELWRLNEVCRIMGHKKIKILYDINNSSSSHENVFQVGDVRILLMGSVGSPIKELYPEYLEELWEA